MKHTKNILFILLALVICTSCKKSNIGDYQSYVGIWSNTDGNTTHKIEIKSDGKSIYEKVTNSGSSTKTVKHEGKFILEDSELKIGFKKFTVNKEPTLANNTWLVTIDNVEYSGK